MNTIINFKSTKEMRAALKIAAANSLMASSSEFIKKVLYDNDMVIKALKDVERLKKIKVIK